MSKLVAYLLWIGGAAIIGVVAAGPLSPWWLITAAVWFAVGVSYVADAPAAPPTRWEAAMLPAFNWIKDKIRRLIFKETP